METNVRRKLAAILSTDVAGYSRLMGEDEEATLRLPSDYRGKIDTLIDAHEGRVVGRAGDSVMAEFGSAVEAARCGVEMQDTLRARNEELELDRRMQFRIGINLGDVMIEGDDLFGDGVNVAARLEKLAPPGGLCISGTVFEQVRDRLPFDFEDLGEQSVKNITRPVHVYRVPLGQTAPGVADNKAPELPDRPSIAVLPFNNMSGDPEQEYFSDGITEDIITDLSKVAGLFVIARNSVFAYKGKSINVAEVGRELGVRHVLEGSVRKAGNRVRITAQLIDGADGGHLWADRYDRDLQDIFAVQDEVTQKIVAALQVKLSEGERARLAHKDTENLEAYDELLRGKQLFLEFTKESNLKAQQMYERAIALDPDYAAAHAELARVYVQARNHGWSDDGDAAMDKAFEHASAAVARDEALAQAHVVLAFILVWRKDLERALTEVERGLALDPNHADGHSYQAIIQGFAGRPEESVRWVDKAMRLNPAAPFWYLWALGVACFSLGRYQDVVAACRKCSAANPNFVFAHLYLAAAYGQLDQKAEAAAEVEACRRLNHEASTGWARRVMPFADAAVLERFVHGLSQAGLPE